MGEAAASALGLPPEHVFKTLVADVDGTPVCAIVPTSGTLSLKALASAAGGKRARMVDPANAERLTGFVTGGISPLGQLRPLPTFVDASVLRPAVVHISAGRRGLQLALAAADPVSASGAVVVEGLGL